MSERHLFLGFLLIMGFSAIFWAYSSNPPNGRAGDPPSRMTCTQCHDSFALNSGDGMLSIDNVPDIYTPGETYTITVTLSDPGQSRWGFELTTLDDDNAQAGTIVVTEDTNTQLSDNSGSNPDYIKQRSAGTFAGTNDGPVSWTFDWTAPLTDVGEVTFYASGNAANNNESTSGDYVYTASATSSTCVKGDANGDGTIDVLDALRVVGFILSHPPITGEDFCRSDCNIDGAIDVLDILGIVNVILGTGTCP
ncbi:MAG: hypothetical protein JSV84_14470 [Gemmatimonadota bacterium]|nr:MAG: hypothetical protein JSV84_14470 [Gemmatimonadota bacterium]